MVMARDGLRETIIGKGIDGGSVTIYFSWRVGQSKLVGLSSWKGGASAATHAQFHRHSMTDMVARLPKAARLPQVFSETVSQQYLEISKVREAQIDNPRFHGWSNKGCIHLVHLKPLGLWLEAHLKRPYQCGFCFMLININEDPKEGAWI